MLRLVVWAIVFSAGFWVGMQYQGVTTTEACLNAGGTADPRGFCVAPDP